MLLVLLLLAVGVVVTAAYNVAASIDAIASNNVHDAAAFDGAVTTVADADVSFDDDDVVVANDDEICRCCYCVSNIVI